MFIERTDVEAETPILWPLDVKNWLIGKDPDAGKDWRREEKGTAEDEMVGWRHRPNGHEFEQALGVWWWTGKPGVLQFMGSQSQTQLSDWTELKEGSRQWLRPWVWGTSHCFIGYISVVFGVFTNLCIQYHYLIPEHFITPQNKHCIN